MSCDQDAERDSPQRGQKQRYRAWLSPNMATNECPSRRVLRTRLRLRDSVLNLSTASRTELRRQLSGANVFVEDLRERKLLGNTATRVVDDRIVSGQLGDRGIELDAIGMPEAAERADPSLA